MPDFVTFDDHEDTLEYTSVEEVTIGFAQNGCTLSFWGRSTATEVGTDGIPNVLKGDYKEHKMVFPSLVVAFDMIKELEKCQTTK